MTDEASHQDDQAEPLKEQLVDPVLPDDDPTVAIETGVMFRDARSASRRPEEEEDA
jgi:hypothetical protein